MSKPLEFSEAALYTILDSANHLDLEQEVLATLMDLARCYLVAGKTRSSAILTAFVLYQRQLDVDTQKAAESLWLHLETWSSSQVLLQALDYAQQLSREKLLQSLLQDGQVYAF